MESRDREVVNNRFRCMTLQQHACKCRMVEQENDRDAIKEDLSSFLAKVDEIGELVKDLTSSDPEGSSLAIKKADEYLERKGKRDNEGLVTQDRTVISKKEKSSGNRSVSSSGPSEEAAVTEFPNREAAEFCHALEEDARERGERRKEREVKGKAKKKRGNEAFRRGEYASSIEHFTEAIAQTPWDISLYTNRALAHNQLGQYEEAVKDCDTAIRYEPSTLRAYIHKGKALAALGKFQQAEECYREACKMSPKDREQIEGYIRDVKTTNHIA